MLSVRCSLIFCSETVLSLLQGLYEDHAVSCAGIVGIKHRHNVVRDTLVDICYRSGISYGNEVDNYYNSRSLATAIFSHVLLYSWDCGRDVCVDLTELEKDAVTLLKRIRKFSVAQDIEARAAIHIFSRVSFAIAKGMGVQIVSRLPSNLL
ncbi:hypothetical protein Tco_1398178 [Tanacetum coccineum]